MKTTQQINQQTSGPVAVNHTGSVMEGYCQPLAIVQRGAPNILAGVFGDVTGGLPKAEANARLLAAAYTAFDAAGRALGIDAATLAASVDVAALIRAARAIIASHGAQSPGDTETPLDAAIYALSAALPPGETAQPVPHPYLGGTEASGFTPGHGEEGI